MFFLLNPLYAIPFSNIFAIKLSVKQALEIHKFINLPKLLGNIPFLTVNIMVYNKLLLITKNAFINIKANGYLFINVAYAKRFRKIL